MTTKLAKSELVAVARSRAVAMTTASLRAASVDSLTKLLGEITIAERQQLSQQQQARSQYAELNLADLKDLCRSNSLAVSGSKAELIDRLLQAGPTASHNHDPSQDQILADYQEPLLVINAGPGSGKTTTLAKLAHKVVQTQPGSRIVVLMYNRNARAAFRDKLKLTNTKISPKTKLLTGSGLFVVTFDEYIHHTRLIPHGLGWAGGDNSGYRTTFETGLALKLHQREIYHYLVIDEAQDLLPNHVSLIEQLWTRAAHIIIAGDPRQEIYVGAGWFPRLWINTKPTTRRTLQYNHRASPDLVALINSYSAKHFPSLHYDQMAGRVDSGDNNLAVTYVILERDHIADYLAPVMLAGSASAYVIAPVTIDKFNTATIVTALRQNLYQLKPGVTFHSGEGELSPGLAIGNAYTYKGTERSAVYVIQSDLPYTDYGISAVMVQKLVYVAISRARDHLTVILSRKPSPVDLWHGLVPAELQISQVKATKLTKPQEFLNVSEDLARLECWPAVNTSHLADFNPVEIEIKQDSDFVGILIETHLATQLGVSNNFTYKFTAARIQAGKAIDPVGIFVNDLTQTYEVTFDPTKSGLDCDNLLQLQQAAETHPEYTRAVIKMSANIGKIWTVSERLMTVRPDLTATVTSLQTILKQLAVTGVPQHGQRLLSDIFCHRSDLRVGAVVGESDFTWPSLVVELKHCSQTEPRHINQVRLYQSLLGCSSALLVNTKVGQILSCPQLPLSYLHNVTRAILAFKYACVCAEKLPHRVKTVAQSQVYISVDLEFTTGDSTTIYEIGAVAYQPNTDRVLGAFHRLWSGTTALDLTEVSSDPFQQLTGLRRNDNPNQDDLADQISMPAEFAAWLDTLTTKPTFVYWGSTDHDLSMLGIKTSQKINAMLTFRAWLDNSQQSRRGNYSLTDAVRQCLNEIPFQAHRAYEDAVLTAAVLTAITNADTAV